MKVQLTPNREHIIVFDRGVTDVIKLFSIII